MGVLKTDVELTKDINIPGYEVNSNPNKEDINKLIYMIKEAKKPLELISLIFIKKLSAYLKVVTLR